MTISTTTNRVRVAGDGSTVAFSFPYYFEKEAHLLVILSDAAGTETVQIIGADYTVSGAGDNGGGTVTFTTAPSASEVVTIIRQEPLTQETDADDVGTFREQAFENQFDRFARMSQRLFEPLGRALKFRRSSATKDIYFPEPDADKLIGWNAAGDGLENSAAADVGLTPLPVVPSTYLKYDGSSYVGRTFAQVRGDLSVDNLAGHRNKIINGDFDIWQRGVSQNSIGDGDYTTDRWAHFRDGSGATINASRQLHAIGQTDVPGDPKHFLRFDQTVSGSGASFSAIVQRIEGVETLEGGDVTVTFYARFASPGTLPAIRLGQQFGTGGTPSLSVITTFATSVAVGTAFTKFQYNFILPTIAGKTLGTNGDDRLELLINLPINSVMTFDLSRVSVVSGNATAEIDPFAPRHIGQELVLCQRYFEKNDTSASGVQYDGPVTSGVAATSPLVLFAVQKREVPVMSLTNNFNWRFPAAVGVSPADTAGFSEQRTADATDSRGYFNSSWQADAEL